VLPDTERNRIIRDTAPESFRKKAEELQKRSQQIDDQHPTAEVMLDEIPPGFDMRYAGFAKKDVHFDPATRTLTTAMPLADKDVKALLVAAGDPQFRDTLNGLYVQSSAFRVSAWWLFWFYIFSTLGELCLSPVGLSMVSKLAPAKFATMLMGLWLLTTFFGNFAAGAFGEKWGEWTPTYYFILPVVALGSASLILFVLVRKIVAMMHGVD
jgi:POT family proton-dependent oligopeptide transporter